MIRGEDADRLLVSLRGRVTDFLQLNIELIHGQRCAITVVHIQHKELQQEREKESMRIAMYVSAVYECDLNLN